MWLRFTAVNQPNRKVYPLVEYLMYVNKLLSACKWKGMGMGFKGQEKKVTPVLPLMLLVPLFIIFSF